MGLILWTSPFPFPVLSLLGANSNEWAVCEHDVERGTSLLLLVGPSDVLVYSCSMCCTYGYWTWVWRCHGYVSSAQGSWVVIVLWQSGMYFVRVVRHNKELIWSGQKLYTNENWLLIKLWKAPDWNLFLKWMLCFLVKSVYESGCIYLQKLLIFCNAAMLLCVIYRSISLCCS